MEKLGLGYETLKRNNSKIIYAACSGFGQTGQVGHGVVVHPPKMPTHPKAKRTAPMMRTPSSAKVLSLISVEVHLHGYQSSHDP